MPRETRSLDVAGPMERLVEPRASRLLRARHVSKLGVDSCRSKMSRAQLTARPAAGQGVALVADRVDRRRRGGGDAVRCAGRLPRRPADPRRPSRGAETYIVTMTRIGWDRWSARLDQLDDPRQRVAPREVAAAIAGRGAHPRGDRRPRSGTVVVAVLPDLDDASRRSRPPNDRRPATASSARRPPWTLGIAPTCTSTRWRRTASTAWRRSSMRAVARGLSIIAITDHERIDGAQAARADRARAGTFPIEVIVGEEITTRNGHLVGLFMRERIAPWGSMRDARSPRPRAGRHRDRGPPTRAVPALRLRRHDPAPAGRRRPARPSRRDRGVQPDHRRDALDATRARSSSRSAVSPRSAAATRIGRATSARWSRASPAVHSDDLRRAIAERQTTLRRYRLPVERAVPPLRPPDRARTCGAARRSWRQAAAARHRP